jgi:hypothetical protein
LIDYLMVFALFLLLVVLSLPTIVHLSAILKEEGSTSPDGKQTEGAHPRFVSVPSSSRLTSIV